MRTRLSEREISLGEVVCVVGVWTDVRNLHELQGSCRWEQRREAKGKKSKKAKKRGKSRGSTVYRIQGSNLGPMARLINQSQKGWSM